MRISHPLRGFAAIGVVIALSILAAMAAGLGILSATNQSTRTQQLYMDQAFLSVHAAFEYALRQIQVGGNPNPIPARDFSGSAFSLRRYMLKVRAVASKGTATNAYSISDPNPPLEAPCLIINTASAALSSNKKKLEGITLQRNMTLCPEGMAITAMKISWTPDGGEKVQEIHIKGDQPIEYIDGQGLPSGSTFVFTSPFDMVDNSVDPLNFVRWKTSLSPSSKVTLIFIMEDASTVTITVL